MPGHRPGGSTNGARQAQAKNRRPCGVAGGEPGEDGAVANLARSSGNLATASNVRRLSPDIPYQ